MRPSGGPLAWKTHAGSVHLEDLSNTFAAGLSVSMQGGFSAASFVLTSLGYDLPVGNAPRSDNIFVTGYRGGQRVAWMGLALPEAIGARATYSLGADFQDLDELTINIITPIDVNGCGTPCAQFDLEEVSLDPAQVPLPASLPMVLTGVAAIGAVRRRHRS